MIYEKINADERLAYVVKCYYYWEQETEGENIRLQSPPSGYEAIVFNFGDTYRISTVMRKKIISPKAFYSGQNTGNYEICINGKIKVFGVVLVPGAFARLFRVSVSGTVDRRLSLNELLGDEAHQLTHKLTTAQHTEERVQLMNELLLQKFWISKLHADPVDEAARLIMEHNGTLPIQELVKKISCSRRTLERKFVDKTGVSPKMLARICRFAHMSYLMMYRKVNWQELVYEGGYTDQSHFIKDFQYFNRQKPSEYLQHHQELIKFLK